MRRPMSCYGHQSRRLFSFGRHIGAAQPALGLDVIGSQRARAHFSAPTRARDLALLNPLGRPAGLGGATGCSSVPGLWLRPSRMYQRTRRAMLSLLPSSGAIVLDARQAGAPENNLLACHLRPSHYQPRSGLVDDFHFQPSRLYTCEHRERSGRLKLHSLASIVNCSRHPAIYFRAPASVGSRIIGGVKASH